VCDGALPAFRDQVLAVVGGGDSAMEEATYLTKFASEVVIIHRRDSSARRRSWRTARCRTPRSACEWNAQVAEVLGDDFITGVRLEDTETGATEDWRSAGCSWPSATRPTRRSWGQLELHRSTATSRSRALAHRTSVPGVFAAGDVMDDYYRQAVTAAGTGCMAALEAERWLAHHGVAEAEPPVLETAESSVGTAEAGAV
jgi:thioredoxin reductase (NADPH)